ncbi:hypothetical protein CcaverHIS631_0302050 [Cutaneotrichosporon cavernicola]|nr:hypothetical protein CcaverHIS631_0302050 [Cutaneotrichosporon cavernicola]
MLFSQFHERLEHNLAKHNLSVKSLLDMYDFPNLPRALGRAKREAAAERAQAVLLVKQQAVRSTFAAVLKAVASGRERLTQAIEAERQQHRLALEKAMGSAAAEKALALGKAVDAARACIVCYEDQASQMPYTCQHAMFCNGCAVRIVHAKNGCPICHRRSVRPKKKWRVFLP